MSDDHEDNAHGVDDRRVEVAAEQKQADRTRCQTAHGRERHIFDREQQDRHDAEGDQPRTPVEDEQLAEQHQKSLAALEAVLYGK